MSVMEEFVRKLNQKEIRQAHMQAEAAESR